MSNSRSEQIKEVIVGVFVTVIFLGLAAFTIVISGATLFRNNNFEIEVVIPDAMGLRKNDLVIAKGTTVGDVTDVFYNQDGVHIKALLRAPVVFHEGYDITVVSTSILGGRQLHIFEGNPENSIVENTKQLKGRKPADLFEDATAAVKRVRDFLDTGTLDNLENFSKNISEISDRLNNGEGTLGKLLSSNDEVYTNLNAVVSNIRSITDRLESGEGTLGRLLSNDDTIYTDLQKTVSNLSEITGRLREGEGTLGKLLSDDETVYADLKKTMENLRLISERLETGEGTLGKLLSSDTSLYDNIDGSISDIRELLDDVREASTLSTFTSMLFSGF